MAKKTLLVCGYGPGISDAVAKRFGAEGFQVALVARHAERVEQGAAALRDAGVTAKGFACDLGDTSAVAKLVADVKAALGPVTVLHWNAYAMGAGDLLTADVADLRKVFDVGVHGLVTAVQKVTPEMKGQENPAVLITGGGFALYDSNVDAMAVQFGAMGLALAKATQHKLAGVLNHRLKGEGVYVGEIVVLGSVKGTAFDGGQATLDPKDIAEKFWEIYTGRAAVSVNFSG